MWSWLDTKMADFIATIGSAAMKLVYEFWLKKLVDNLSISLKVPSSEIGSGHAYCRWIVLIKDMCRVDSQFL